MVYCPGEANSFDGYQISRHWSQLPPAIREGFGRPPSRVGVLLKHDASGFLERPDVILFLMRFRGGGNDLLIARTVSRATASQLVGRNMSALLMIGAASALAFAVVLWLLMRRVSRPVAELGAWARKLDNQNKVEVELTTDSSVIALPETAARILLGKLIRNAFQHTWEGHVSITQRHTSVRIENRQATGSDLGKEASSGFGLGLQLTEKLAERLRWRYQNASIKGGRLVDIRLGS